MVTRQLIPTKRWTLFAASLLMASAVFTQTDPLDSLLHTIPLYRDSIAPREAEFELQILFRPLTGPDSNRTYRYGVDPDRYFYPASTVKLPVAALALQHLRELGVLGLDVDTPLEVDSTRPPQSVSRERVGMPGTAATVRGHVRDIALVSSNEAYNRLYEWLGPRYVNTELHRRGYTSARIVHRLSAPGFDTTENRYLPPVRFRASGTGGVLWSRGQAFAKTPYAIPLTGEQKGRAYLDANDSLVLAPFDFAAKNFLSVEDLADLIQAVVLPETVDSLRRFDLAESDRRLFVGALTGYPRDSENPLHRELPDGYVKFFLYGGAGERRADGVRVINKVGDAYGTLTDAAVIVDPVSGGSFVLVATVNVNRNGVYNDGVYGYEGIGFPFLKGLGEVMLEYVRNKL